MRGKVSWFGGPNDSMDSGRTASGGTTRTPGVAVRPGGSWTSGKRTLGGYWRITDPKTGRSVVLKQTDLGPNESTGRRIDVTYSALRKFGYSEKNFPTDAVWKAEYLGKNPKSGGGSVGSPSRTTTSVGPDYRAQARRQAAAQWLLSNGKDPIQLAASVRAAEDAAPAQQTTTTTSRSSQPQRAAGGKRLNWRAQGLSPIKELFYDPQGGWKGNQQIGAIGGHSDHVHFAAGPKTTVRLGKRAQQMGLHVGENPRFGGVHPVHVANSNHYRNEAIDVSGDPRKMAAFSRYVRRLYKLK